MKTHHALSSAVIHWPSLKRLGVVSLILWGGSSALPVGATPVDADLTARGAYLVTAFGCADCHTPLKPGPNGPEPDKSRTLSGHPETFQLPPPPKADGSWTWFGAATNTAFAGPWGITYASNLTPDPDTGLGRWKAEDFVQAMKTGKHVGVARPIMPPMPWQALSHLTGDDLRAMFQYLHTLPPIRNRVPDYQPPH